MQHRTSGARCTLKIFRAEKCFGEPACVEGTIKTDGKKAFEVCVKGGMLRILELQLAGKRRMGVEEFLRGFRLEEYQLADD